MRAASSSCKKKLEQPGSAVRIEALARDSEQKEAPLSQASHAHGF
jgi:hypothetical protein